jgi:TPR repeat protein
VPLTVAAPKRVPRTSGSSGFLPIGWLVLLGVLVLGPVVVATLYSSRRRVARFVSFRAPIPSSGAALPPEPRTNGHQPAALDHDDVGLTREQQRRALVATAYRRADQAGDANGAFNLGVLLEEQGDVTGAEAAYRRAEERGHAAALSNLGVLLEERGDLAGAEGAYRRADQRGDANGAFNLGVLLEEQGDVTGAEAAYRRADAQGHTAAAANLGVLLDELGDRAGAEKAYRRADERGDANGAFNLGVLLERQRDPTGAEAAYRRAEQRGDAKVAQMARAALHDLAERVMTPAGHNGGESIASEHALP